MRAKSKNFKERLEVCRDCPHFPSSHVNLTTRNHSTTRKSWRSDAPIILPGWEYHTGGSRSKPTVHRCRPKTGGCGLLTRTQNEPTKQHGSGVENQHGSGASVAVPQPARPPASSAQCVNKAMISSRSGSTQDHRVSRKHRVSRSTVEVQAGVQQEHDGRRHRDPDKRDAARAEQSRLELRS